MTASNKMLRNACYQLTFHKHKFVHI